MDESGVCKCGLQLRYINMPIVVPQHIVDAVGGSQAAERFGDPVNASLAFDDVAGDGDNIGVKSVCRFDNSLEVLARDAARHVEVCEMNNPQRLVGKCQPRD